MILFVTVGTTKFELLIERILSGVFFDVLHRRNYRQIIVQYGGGSFNHRLFLDLGRKHGVIAEAFPFTNNIGKYIESAYCVISHCGSGTVFEVLRSSNKPFLVAIANEALLDNHQQELADELKHGEYCHVSTLSQLHGCFSSEAYQRKYKELPAPQPGFLLAEIEGLFF
ncbi:MAG: UDP-N-acetylglucosamine transferase subunit ALG13-like protein [Amphiamblys sp. WSBS2006]|nr:MAG: UDP-N-acetylglucosamine transferase subunit ALG13-like protein [Amphiamblys sp. WSBS2006]